MRRRIIDIVFDFRDQVAWQIGYDFSRQNGNDLVAPFHHPARNRRISGRLEVIAFFFLLELPFAVLLIEVIFFRDGSRSAKGRI